MTSARYLAQSNASPERQEQKLRAKMPADTSGCWTWPGQTTAGGYGQIRTGPGTRDYVHRVAHRLWKGPIPDGFQIDHLCRNRACFNPDHLEAVTPRTNFLRGHAVGALLHDLDSCAKGHALEGANVIRNSNGTRRCRTCLNDWQRARYSARRAAAGLTSPPTPA